MLLPFAEKAFIDDRKLTDYCLSESHPIGKHKVRVFKSALGLSLGDFQFLKDIILNAILTSEAVFVETSEFGELYVVDIEVENPPQKAFVRSSWIIKFEESFPRLSSCYVITK